MAIENVTITDCDLNSSYSRQYIMDIDSTTTTKSAVAPKVPDALTGTRKGEKKDLTSKDYYFDSYAHFGIHEEMLKDEVRTESYRDAIMKNRHLFKDKVVLDVGCGTGVLSMFAAKAGAKMVIGVEMSGIVRYTKKIIAANGFEDKIVLLNGKMEEVKLPVEKVDIIISEWMGYFLLYESMLDTVIYARDKYLKKDGLILPDRATLKICAIEDEEYRKEKLDYWDNVYGFDMTCIKEDAMIEPLVDIVEGDAVISNTATLYDIDIKTVKVEDLNFVKNFRIVFNTDKISCHALVAYFDIAFDQGLDTKVTFGTGPDDEYTHWKQTVFYLQDVVDVNCGGSLSATLTCAPNKGNPRDLDISIDYAYDCTSGSPSAKQEYRLR